MVSSSQNAGVGGERIDLYGSSFADVYDDWYPPDPDCIATLADLAGEGHVLDLGCGTAVIAEALAAQGTPVVGVDASAEMLARRSPARGPMGAASASPADSRYPETTVSGP